MNKGDVCYVRTHTGEIKKAVYGGTALCHKDHYVFIGKSRCLACRNPSPRSLYRFENVRFVVGYVPREGAK